MQELPFSDDEPSLQVRPARTVWTAWVLPLTSGASVQVGVGCMHLTHDSVAARWEWNSQFQALFREFFATTP